MAGRRITHEVTTQLPCDVIGGEELPISVSQTSVCQHVQVAGAGEARMLERGPLTLQIVIACVHLPHARLGTQRGAAHPLPLAGARDRTLVLGQMREAMVDRDDVSRHGTDLCVSDADQVAS